MNTLMGHKEVSLLLSEWGRNWEQMRARVPNANPPENTIILESLQI